MSFTNCLSPLKAVRSRYRFQFAFCLCFLTSASSFTCMCIIQYLYCVSPVISIKHSRVKTLLVVDYLLKAYALKVMWGPPVKSDWAEIAWQIPPRANPACVLQTLAQLWKEKTNKWLVLLINKYTQHKTHIKYNQKKEHYIMAATLSSCYAKLHCFTQAISVSCP